MFSGNSSIKTQIAICVISMVLALALIYGFLSVSSLTTLSKQQVKYAEKELEQSVIAVMQDAGQLEANRVTGFITESFVTAINLANIFATTAHPSKPFSREDVMSITASSLQASDTVSAIYVHFEKDGYDNNDAAWAGHGVHSTNTGSLEVYYIKENGAAVSYEIDDSSEKYAAEKDENGIRNAEWYLCSRDSNANCALDPYLYEIEKGKEELMTTLTSPISVAGQFRGLVGADINLPVVQRWLKAGAKSLFDGHGHISLVSQRRLLIASSQYADSLSQPIKNVSESLLTAINSRESTLEQGNNLVVKLPIQIKQANTEWTLVISVPKDVAYASIIEMKKMAEESLQSTIFTFVMFSLLAFAAAFFIALWLARSITSPIRLVSYSIAKLADQEGDLTQSVEIKKHAELIKLASGFNRFIGKLAEMIGVSKQNVQELAVQQQSLQVIAQEVETDTQSQQGQLDSVATAVTEMASAASEVANIAAQTATDSSHASTLLNETQSILQQSVVNVEDLATGINLSSEQVSQVANRSNDISSIVVTIQSIAEQTNLLALNAAIEAARAGEQGRGFAVVADEVRNLAARTQSSTQEISTLIDNLQADVNTTVSSLQAIHESVSQTVDNTTDSLTRLTDTLESVEQISEGSIQVASAAQEQSAVSEDINERLILVSDSSKQLAQLGYKLKEQSEQSKLLADKVESQLSRLKV